MDPVAEIIDARQAALQQHDPHVDVCFLATVTAQGRPEVRAGRSGQPVQAARRSGHLRPHVCAECRPHRQPLVVAVHGVEMRALDRAQQPAVGR